jgi:hypothetical protein
MFLFVITPDGIPKFCETERPTVFKNHFLVIIQKSVEGGIEVVLSQNF